VFNSTVGATGDFLAILARQMLGEHRKEGAGELKSPRIWGAPWTPSLGKCDEKI